MPKEFQQICLTLLAELLANGFTFQESIRFLGMIYPKQLTYFKLISRMIEEGEPIYKSFQTLGFKEKYVAQINLGEKHGDLVGTFLRVTQQMKDMEKQKQGLQKVLTYPLILLGFLFLMIVGMKYVLIPQMGASVAQDNIGIYLINHAPQYLVGFISLLVIIYVGFTYFFKKKTEINKLFFLMKIPIVRRFISSYYTAFFAYEWGKLLTQGIELRTVLRIMTEEGNTKFMQEIGSKLQIEMQKGEVITKKIGSWPFFLEGFSVIIQQGEAKGRLGDELMIYGSKLWEDLLKKIEKGTQWLQPVVFLLIALLIVGVYGALLLPVYGSMEGLL